MTETSLTLLLPLRIGDTLDAISGILESIAVESALPVELLVDRGGVADEDWLAFEPKLATLPVRWSVQPNAAFTMGGEAEQVERMVRGASGRHVALLRPGQFSDGVRLSALLDGLPRTRCALLAHPVAQLQTDGVDQEWTVNRGLGQIEPAIALGPMLHRASLCWDSRLVLDWPALATGATFDSMLLAILVRAVLTGLVGWTPQSTLRLAPATAPPISAAPPSDIPGLTTREQLLSLQIRATLAALQQVQVQRQRDPRSGRACDQVTSSLLRALVADTERWTLTRNALLTKGLRPFWVDSQNSQEGG